MIVTLISIRIRMETPGGVVGTESYHDDRHVLHLRRDPDGHIHLPGTTVAGSLRAHCADDAVLSDQFGSVPPQAGAQPGASRQPSAIRVLGTLHHGNDTTCQHTRTSIDRERAAARNMTYHIVEQLLPGTEFDIVLRWDDSTTGQRAALEDRLRTWRPYLGRGVSQGAGRCEVVGWAMAHYDLTTPDGLLSWITNVDFYPTPTPRTGVSSSTEEASQSHGPITWEMEIVDGLHFGVPDQGDKEPNKRETYRLPATDGIPGAPGIPGSTLKGVLRSRAEYICRVVGAGACHTQSCGICWPCTLFGFSGKDGSQRAALSIPSAEITHYTISVRPHVAIDRFNGGAKPGALYQDELITSGRFTIILHQLRTLVEAEKRLLETVVADLHDGYVGLGARTTSGQGTVRLISPPRTELNPQTLASTLRTE